MRGPEPVLAEEASDIGRLPGREATPAAGS